MPRYKVTTDQGVYQFDADTEDPQEAQSAFAAMHQASQIPTAAPTFTPLQEQLKQINWREALTSPSQLGTAALGTAKDVGQALVVDPIKSLMNLPAAAAQIGRQAGQIDWGELAKQPSEITQAMSGIAKGVGKAALVGGPATLGAFYGGAPGAMTGAAAGQSTLSALEQLFGGEPKTARQVLGETASAALPAAIGARAPGRSITALTGRGALPEEIPAARSALESIGVEPGLSDISKSGLARSFENISGRMIGGRGIVETSRQNVADKLRQAFEGRAGELGETAPRLTSAEQTAQDVMNTKNQLMERYNQAISDISNEATQRGVTIGKANITSKINDLMDELNQIQDPELRTMLSGKYNPLLKRLTETELPAKVAEPSGLLDVSGRPLPGREIAPAKDISQLPYNEADQIRKAVGSMLNDKDLIASIDQGKLKAAYGGLKRDIAADLPEDLRGPLDALHAGYEKNIASINDTLAGRLAAGKVAPEQLRNAFKRESDVLDLKRLSPNTFEQERAGWFSDFINKHITGDTINASNLARDWKKLDPGLKQTIFDDPAQLAKINQTFKAAETFGERAPGIVPKPGGQASVLPMWQMMHLAGGTTGAIAGMMMGHPLTAVAALVSALISPGVARGMAKFATSPGLATRAGQALPSGVQELEHFLAGAGAASSMQNQ